jgi:GTPase SAR1 family protein
MGQGGSSQNQDNPVPIEKKEPNEEKLPKLLMLGTGETGKTTILKQLTMIFGEGIEGNDRTQFHSPCEQLIIEFVHDIVKSHQDFFKGDPEFEMSNEAKSAASLALDWDSRKDPSLTKEKLKACKALWSDRGFQMAADRRKATRLPPKKAIAHFLDNMDRFSAGVEAKVSNDDLLLVRVRTTGLVEKKLTIDNVKFVLVDSGGQRNERRKWVHAYEGTTVLVYVVSLGDYCEVCFEDENVNRIVDSLKCLEEVANLECLADVPIVLLFNKKDFVEKFRGGHFPLSSYFTDWSGTTEDDAYEYFSKMFKSKIKGHGHIYSYVFDVTNVEECEDIFKQISCIIRSTNTNSCGENQ